MVLDEGCGLPTGLDRLTAPGTSTKSKDQGHLGMGLPIAQRAIESMQGSFRLTPRSGAGASCEIRWPRDGYSEMRVLIVEDDVYVAAELNNRFSSLEPSIDTVIARSRSSGIEALQGGEFDFIICDLRLPPNDGGLDTDEAHGLAVHSEARTISPGTPCLFFTGFGTSPQVLEELSSGGTQDILGTGADYSMTRLLTKDQSLNCVERLESFNTELAALDDITINLSGDKSQS